MANSKHDQTGEDRHILIKKLDAVGWGIFFIWIGIAFLADVGWGIGLLGIGIILLGGQMGRMHFNLPVEGFWLVMGILVVVAGAWELLKLNIGEEPIPGGFIPILSIVIGVALVASALLRKRR
ncbi:MAG TPA: hypothetical protein VJ577_10355 [Burkholderiaceae bacterium]|nr:hypothetical protein [Burkholderiaceae bacterium]